MTVLQGGVPQVDLEMSETHNLAMIARLAFIWFLSLASSLSIACTCVPPPPTATTYRALAEWRVRQTSIVFEGKVERIAIAGWPIKPVPGKIVKTRDMATLTVSFSGVGSYRGEVPAEVKVETGLGGGDCGFAFQEDESYLVFAWKGDDGALSTGICSGTMRLQDADTELRLLRGEPPTPADLAEWRTRLNTDSTVKSVGLKVCGKISLPEGVKAAGLTVAFWPAGHEETALFRYLTADAEMDGSYCMDDLSPGKYLIGAFNPPQKHSKLRLMSYYPGVKDRSQATPMMVDRNNKAMRADFPLLVQPVYRVHGYLRGCPDPPARSIVVVLMSSVPDHFHASEPVQIGPHGSFEFTGILAGHYTIFAAAENEDDSMSFLSAGVDIDITEDLEGVRLDYTPDK